MMLLATAGVSGQLMEVRRLVLVGLEASWWD
jgi:hypothetical protein